MIATPPYFQLFVVFFNDTATTEIYTYVHTLSLHDALPIYFQRGESLPARLATASVRESSAQQQQQFHVDCETVHPPCRDPVVDGVQRHAVDQYVLAFHAAAFAGFHEVVGAEQAEALRHHARRTVIFAQIFQPAGRSDERRVGKEGVSPCGSRCRAYL